MIIYDKLWETMKKRKITQYKLIKDFGFSRGQLDRIKKNQNISSYTIDRLCNILHCNINDIATFIQNS